MGASPPNKLFVNELNSGGGLEERAVELGVDYPLGRGRMPLWWDRDGDGWLDLFITNMARTDGQAPSALFEQAGSGFSPVQEVADTLIFAQLGDLSGDGALELMTLVQDSRYRIYDASSLPLTDVTPDLGPSLLLKVKDAAAADFDGDLRLDVFFARATGPGSEVVTVGDREIKLCLSPLHSPLAEEIGIDFETAGEVSFELGSWGWPLSLIFIGSGGIHPPQHSFTLSPLDPAHQGLMPHQPGDIRAVYVGYDPGSGRWMLRVSGDAILAIVEAEQPISKLDLVDFEITLSARQERLYVQGATGLEEAAVSGLEASTDCTSVTAGDFDNDMDVDVYLVCQNAVENLPNRLYLNDGIGNFAPVADAGGAEGSSLGGGDSAVTADYDRNGFLDLFLTNGEGAPPFNRGPHQLFRNLGNGNHWLEIDLVGVISNRDAIGARLFLTAGGVTQLREQVGGMHRSSQDHQRVHFGLGPNTVADSLEIVWPSGAVQVLEGVPADQLIQVVESTTACSDGIDNDSDGLIDLDDPDCSDAADPLEAPDADGDLVEDALDNCVQAPNPLQQDTDGDDFGNACDCDFDQNLACSIADFSFFREDYLATVDRGVGTDMDGNGAVSIADFSLFRDGYVAGEPGPSGLVP